MAIAAIAVFLSCCSFGVEAQNGREPTIEVIFVIPNQNSTIRFSIPNATFERAQFLDDKWEFINLYSPTQQKINLTLSAQNCNVTIHSYRSVRSNTTMGSIQVRYTVEGERGKQTINFGEIPKRGIWNVVFGRDYMGQEDGWTVSPQGTVTVTGASSRFNITIIYYVYPAFLEALSERPFLERNSVAIATATALATTIVVALFVRRSRKNKETVLEPDIEMPNRRFKGGK